MKLQKLCYYSQAWSLVWDDKPLFEEDFQAWANGPVCKELFDAHRGMFSISAPNITSNLKSNDLTDAQKATIDVVLKYYGNKDAQWLSTLTHMESPWKDTRAGVAPGISSSAIITKESMAQYYGSL